MSIFSNNLRFLRTQRGLNLDEFAFLGIKKGTMSNYELGKTEPKFDVLLSLSNFFRISVDDFLTKILDENCKINCKDDCKENGDLTLEAGKSKSTIIEKDENRTPLFLPHSGKTISTKIVELPVPVSEDSNMVDVPLVDISVAAGTGFYNPDYLDEIDTIRFPKTMVKGNNNYLCVRVKGESMVPTLQDGGYLVIRLLDRGEWQYIRDGHVYVVSDMEGRAFVKRLKNRLFESGFIVCKSDNPDPMGYPSFNLMENEINTIWHAEWYISEKMPNIHATYYNKVSELEDRLEEVRSTLTKEISQVRKEIKSLCRPS